MAEISTLMPPLLYRIKATRIISRTARPNRKYSLPHPTPSDEATLLRRFFKFVYLFALPHSFARMPFRTHIIVEVDAPRIHIYFTTTYTLRLTNVAIHESQSLTRDGIDPQTTGR